VPQPRELRLGTRGSQLALWQANRVAAEMAARGGPTSRIVVIKTSGDRLQDAPLSEVGGKRLFVKEIEDALLRGEIDLAVHSSKDMPAVLPEGLVIGAVLPREDPRDAVVLPAGLMDELRMDVDEVSLKPDTTRADVDAVRLQADTTNADVADVVSGFSRTIETVDELVALLGRSPSIGTGSVRRIAQLSRLFPGARFTPIRGNLDTRLRKLDSGEHDALILAAAGLRRLGFASRITFTLPVKACVPAPGQGIVAVEIRGDDEPVRQAVAVIDDAEASSALAAERTLVEALGGGCQTPLGALASLDGDELELIAAVVALDGSRAIQAKRRGPRADAEELGRRVAADLLADGAGDLLADAQRVPGAVQGLQP
jgi:hydroxymethylbilane synthase